MLETIRSFACGSTSRLSEGAKLLAGAAPERPSHPRPVPALAALHGEAVVGVLRDPMMALATVAFEVYVNTHCPSPEADAGALVAHLPRHVQHGQCPGDGHRNLRVMAMTDPACSDVSHFPDACDVSGRVFDFIEDLRRGAVQHPPDDIPGPLIDEDEDRH